MALPASDNFNAYADADDLSAVAPNWTQPASSQEGVVSHQVAIRTFAFNFNICYWNADVFPNDQKSSCVAAVISGDYLGPTVRTSGSGAGSMTTYWMLGQSGDFRVDRQVAGGSTTIISGMGTAASGDLFELDAAGTTITAFQNGTPVGTTTDTAVSSGACGLAIYHGDSAGRIDNWTGDQIGGAADVLLGQAVL